MKGTAMQYTWRPATGDDVGDIVAMAQSHFQTEIDSIFTPEPTALARNMTFAVVTQFFNPTSELVSVARDQDHRLVAYTWAKAFQRAPWSDDNMVNICMAHVDLTLSARLRLALITDMLTIWDQFAVYCQHPVICSTTMRDDQKAFLRLHERHGYSVRGSYAYKRINPATTQARPANSVNPD
jgi:hypothetical protein